MGALMSSNAFPSRAVPRGQDSKLAILIARDSQRLRGAIEYVKAGALSPETQRFHFIAADLTSNEARANVIAQSTARNAGLPPDVMDANYFSNAYMAHAALRGWLKTEKGQTGPTGQKPKGEGVHVKAGKPPARHIIFTSSFLALYPIAGYAPYSPKETDDGQTPEVVARKSIQGLESGHELVATDFLTKFVLSTIMGVIKRGGLLNALVDWAIGCLSLLILVFVRWDMDRKVQNRGKLHGDSGMKSQ
ncbi:3-ketodihydrosphingosine reductase gsl-3 [Cytospora mali]|uniref:3-ketodihydrosphingosine reductase gsl-3 n=1 Tax=Cytospora mali TaxID=578113 RepID=A0A194WC63_CYTMA|nr:3-ketodihydrosphingosine reductase gsl-3 [Valsa mali]